MGIKDRKLREVEARRALILGTAKTLFIKNGFASVTLDDIAAAVEFSKGTIYNHFVSKEELYAWILLEHLDILLSRLREATGSASGASEKMRNAMRAYVQLYDEHREYFKLLFFIDVVSDQDRIPEKLRKEILHRKIACLLELQNIIKDGTRSGEFGDSRPTAHVGMVLWGMLNGVIQLVESHQVRGNELDRLIGVGFEIVLAGLKRRAE